jgi:hypothetical protein
MANQWTKQYGWMIHTMDNLMVSLWGYQSGPAKVSIFWDCAAKTIAASYVLMAMGK